MTASRPEEALPAGMVSGGRDKPPRGKARVIFRSFAALAVLVAALVALASYRSINERPRIDLLSPSIAEPGALVALLGVEFGDEQGDSYVLVDGMRPTASSYAAWTDRRIEFRMPITVDSGLVSVVTEKGRSNARLFMSASRLPSLRMARGGKGAGPKISGLSADGVAIGGLLVVSGLDFGASRGSGEVLFSWRAESRFPLAEDGAGTIAPERGSFGYELWSDKEIRLRVPDGAVSGNVVVRTDRGSSDPRYLAIAPLPGAKKFGDKRNYSIAYRVEITRIKSAGSNELYLWVPRPALSPSQPGVAVLGMEPQPVVEDLDGAMLYHFQDLGPERPVTIREEFLVQAFSVETQVDPVRIQVPAELPPGLLPYLAKDAFVPADDPAVRALARKIAKGEKNPYRIARAVYDYVTGSIKYSEARRYDKVLDSLASGSGDGYSISLLTCALLRAAGVPSIPVSGYLIDDARGAKRHYWDEFYVYGFGWVPMDPVLGSGASVGGFRPADWPPERYFGNLDARRVVFSRGARELKPMTPSGRLVRKDRQYALISPFEEAAGSLESYSSFWSDIEVTGVY